jgi:hypothetical protein
MHGMRVWHRALVLVLAVLMASKYVLRVVLRRLVLAQGGIHGLVLGLRQNRPLSFEIVFGETD